MPKKRKTRIWWRERWGSRLAWGDFRDYGDVGGGREPLIRQGETYATSDPDAAQILVAARLKELEELRRVGGISGGAARVALFEPYADEHLESKSKARKDGQPKYSKPWLTASEHHLRVAMEFLREVGAGRTGTKAMRQRLGPLMKQYGDIPVHAVTVDEVKALAKHLETIPNGRGGIISSGVQRQYLNSLSNLFVRASSERVVPPNYNPVKAMLDKPTGEPVDAVWYEVPEAALILEGCRVWEPERDAHAVPYLYELVATYLLTGGRKKEVMALEVGDVLFKRRKVVFRRNAWYPRRKTAGAEREVKLWDQLAEILEAYLAGPNRPKGKLLFPSPRFDTDHLLTNVDNALDAVAARLEMPEGHIRCKPFRHTFCSARLQTVEPVRTPTGTGWVEVLRDTVVREMGHGSDNLVRNIYGHLPEHRNRTTELEFRVDAWRAELGERIHLVRPVLRIA